MDSKFYKKFSSIGHYQTKPKSQRLYDYFAEKTTKLRRRFIVIVLLLVLLGAGYFLFYSSVFTIKNLNFSGNDNLASEELEKVIRESLKTGRWLIFPNDNYFFVSRSRLKKDFEKNYPLADIEIKKKNLQTLDIKVIERVGQLVWITQERHYLINLDGQLVKELPAKELVNVAMPKIYDNTNGLVNLKDIVLSAEVIKLISEIHDTFKNYDLKGIELDYYRMDGSKANFVKVVTKQGFEIHLNYQLTLDSQLSKLKRSLDSGKIDLSKIQYINLRVENQVIYR